MLLCECGEFIEGNHSDIFKDYINTSINPSTSTIGHKKCGFIFDFIDNTIPRKYSSKKDLKSLAVKYADKCDLEQEYIGKYLMEVDRLKSIGNMPDNEILITALRKLK